ncbi:MAG TPA: hypothetical protein VLX61_01880 [Anaerolineales bacterium]|nr:hypothetical protein [Anaerolineales bacterium]
MLTSWDPILEDLHFKSYRSKVERRVEPYRPGPNEPTSIRIKTPWGEELIARAGDFLISEIDKPDDKWPIKADIFEETYVIVRPGYCVKRALTRLVPMIEVTQGNEDQLVTVYSLEGVETVRAGDFYLARGVKGEIWAYPKEKVSQAMVLVDEEQKK